VTAPTSQLVQKLWSYCNVLLDAGLTYLDYTEQLTYLLFLKMARQHRGRVSSEVIGAAARTA